MSTDRPRHPCPHCEGRGYREGMTEAEALEYARSGQANYTKDRLLTKLGHDGLWTLDLVGEEPVRGYYAHGGAWVDRAGVFRSRLTKEGEDRLAALMPALHGENGPDSRDA